MILHFQCFFGFQIKKNNLNKVTGIRWDKLTKKLQGYDLTKISKESDFSIFITYPPEYLITHQAEPRLIWKKENETIDDWDKLIRKGFTQLRNNIAHGSKALPAPYNPDRTKKLLSAGYNFMDLIVINLYDL